ncbi:MAG: DUF6242 domain-containing protein [Muribaculaceae bacterium]|nr:DUF6242 domain-containing protein [Muribaculaceae bacterium]
MKKLTILSLAAVLGASAFVGCNESTYTPGEDTASSVVVYSFKLAKDDSVLANLDTVFFSIDLVKGRIFNADSLPFGTPTDKLVPVINLLDGVSRCELTVNRADGTDTTYNYLTNSTDSIDFSRGPVKLMLASPDGLVSKTYSIDVNVHKVKSDSLVWSQAARRTLPTALSTVKAQRTVQCGSTLYCLTTDGSTFSMAHTDTPDADNWQTATAALPAGADIKSFAATDDALYILASGKLYRSTDGGASWSDTGSTFSHIYGGYGTTVLGSVQTAGSWSVRQYPGNRTFALPGDMPVSGTSVPVAFDFGMASAPQIIMVGGRKADGTLSRDTWAFDGSTFAKISNKALPVPVEDVAVVPFFTFRTNNLFITTRHAVMLAIGGSRGAVNNDSVYVSNDYGMTWNTGGQLIQLPDYVPAMANAQAYVYPTTMHSRSSQVWVEFDDIEYRLPAAASRATEPVTEWECPYIYLFGGNSASGSLYNTVWRATINRMTFKPLQ